MTSDPPEFAGNEGLNAVAAMTWIALTGIFLIVINTVTGFIIIYIGNIVDIIVHIIA